LRENWGRRGRGGERWWAKKEANGGGWGQYQQQKETSNVR